MILFHCECGRQLQGWEEDAGRVMECPACGHLVITPAADTTGNERPDQEIGADGREVGDPASCPNRHNGRHRGISGIDKMLGKAGLVLLAVGVVGCMGAGVFALVMPSVWPGQHSRSGKLEIIRLKQINLGLQFFHETHRCLPVGGNNPLPSGKPRVSWRVEILGLVEDDDLRRQYNRNEPWDGPNNRRLLNATPKVYETPGRPAPPGMTYFQVVVGPGTLFEDPLKPAAGGDGFVLPPGRRAVRFEDVTDGTANTLMVVLGKDPVPWTSPQDIIYDPDGPLPQLSDHFSDGANVLMADGTVRFLRKDAPPDLFRALLTRNGGEKVAPDW